MPAASLRLRHSSTRHPVVIDVTRELPQSADRCLLLRGVRERVPVVEPAGILPGDLVDLLIGAPGSAELRSRRTRATRPRGVGVGVVALPGDDVHADPVAQQEAGGIGDVAGQNVVAEDFRWQLARRNRCGATPGSEMAVDPIEVEGDPADPTLGQRDLAARGTAAMSAPKRRSWAVITLICQARTIRWSTAASSGLWMTANPATDVEGEHHVLVAQCRSIGSQ